jgi:hypothetical protein
VPLTDGDSTGSYYALTDHLRQESHILRVYLEEWGLRDFQRRPERARASGQAAMESMGSLIDALTQARDRLAAEIREHR